LKFAIPSFRYGYHKPGLGHRTYVKSLGCLEDE
jgi:hypothetical protein